MAGRFRASDDDFIPIEEQAEGASPSKGSWNPPAMAAAPDDGRGGRGGRGLLAPRLARGVSTVVFAGYGVVTLLNVQNTVSSPLGLVLCTLAVGALYTLQIMLASPRARRWPGGRRAVVLVTQAGLTLGPMVWLGIAWGSMAGPLAGSILLMLPGRFAWPCYSAVPLAILGWSAASDGISALETGYYAVSTALTGLVIYGLTRLTDLVREVHDARAEMARMAVTQERLRFARDLHDLLGYSLSAITLKCELIHRLTPVNPERAREEVASVLGIARQALADVRIVASGYRDMSLTAEAESVAEVMAAADVETELDIDYGRLHPLVDTVLATALREGVTNMLRHSKVQSCTVTVRVEGEAVRLDLVNDGVVAQDRPDAPDRGSGLGNLRTRLAAIGGEMRAGAEAGNRFRLTAVAPLRPSKGEEAEPLLPRARRVVLGTPGAAHADAPESTDAPESVYAAVSSDAGGHGEAGVRGDAGLRGDTSGPGEAGRRGDAGKQAV
ncbi:sensor histidine kinase [Streptomyces sp. NPDC051286]|uniref:sensor histidine kinase n=1 Tax=Streptomyces sp. NPDC051286 TaxID=3365647 RepID=UPI0037AC96D9